VSLDANLNSDELFETVDRAPSLSQFVAQQIEDAIRDGRIQPGDKLPTERELGRQFGVSRTVVREAIHGLEARNLVSVQPGAGTVVRAPTSQMVSETLAFILTVGRKRLDFRELMEVRRFLEIETTGLCAERRTDEELDELKLILDRMAANLNNAETFVIEDISFHEALAKGTHNRLFVVLFNTLMDIMRDLSAALSQQPNTRERALKHHRAIYDQIAAGNRAGAREAMRAHLASAEENLDDIIQNLN
jgi:GntR family transcriptional repressor for pyruvate dehydrogenase complex